MNFDGQVVWITGASRGIGRATAEHFARLGATLVLGARTASALEPVASAISDSAAVPPMLVPYDVADPAQVKEAFRSVAKAHSRLDVLVNAAGAMVVTPLSTLTYDNLEGAFRTNAFSAIQHMQLGARLMARNKSGSIVNLSSIVGRLGAPGQIAYAASKAAIIGASLAAAKELVALGIRVNVVAPGFIATDLTSSLSAQVRSEAVEAIGMKRAGAAHEVADAIVFLASSMSSYITGQVLGVDGGMSL
jgi:3-oxoacyl-[acyl-carrier protein] reductase